MLDVRELIRRLQLGEGDRPIARDLQLSRKTVSKYRSWAQAEGLMTGPLPDPAVLQARLEKSLPAMPPPRCPSIVEPFREKVVALRQRGVECQAILQRLREENQFPGSYASVYRFVRSLEPGTPEAFVRIETAPGEEAQVDFGFAGKMFDRRTRLIRRTWAFVMTLSFSRHQYVEFVFDQEVGTWLRCHQNAFEFFGGIPHRVVLDNLKAAIVKAALYDPVVQRAYRECAEHYGFLISPCRPRTPRHKGKVEQGGVHYVKRNFIAGRAFRDSDEANEKVGLWCLETAGRRIHGTTKEPPLKRFDEAERDALRPLPCSSYTLAFWKKAKLHPDCHVVFEGSFYSAPHRLIGKSLWVRATDQSVTLFHEHDLVGSHPRARRKGQRFTLPDHLPPAKLAGLMASPASCLKRAGEIGPATADLIGRLLGERPLDRLRTAHGILRLAHKFSPRRLEAACQRALHFDETSYGAVKRILVKGLDLAPPPSASPPVSSQPLLFVRPWTDFFPND
ncbi:MAG: IS21 family transposase [Acidobacteria bacterium]|nr:IS21 family transposase [Acidobacteriota bacterium]MCI0657341.1 IS21 family transposase [Acidobacteriota bacterium]